MVLVLVLICAFEFTHRLFRRRLNKWIDRWNYTRAYNRCFHLQTIQRFILRRFLPLMLLGRLLQSVARQNRCHLLNINKRRMHISLRVRASMLTVNLYFIRLQIEKVVLNHLSIKHVWDLLRVLHYLVEKVVVASFIGCYLILLQVYRIFLIHLLAYQVWWLSWNVQRVKLLLLLLTSSYSEVVRRCI